MLWLFKRSTRSILERKQKMKTNRWFANLAALMMIAMCLLAGTPSVIASDATGNAAGNAAGNNDQPSAAAAVQIDNFSFGPQTLTVPVGATVTWTNRDDIPHTAVSTDGAFKSKVMDTDEKFSYTFAKAGTYSYYCTIHPKMTGKVIVQ
jgi:plastocyanin